MNTRNFLRIAGVIVLGVSLQSLVSRHDVSDERQINLAKSFPQICHFNNGEGTLIAARWVLTAAHVGELYNKETDPKKLTVVCNDQKYLIDKVVIHPGYLGDGPDGIKNDIALVRLSSIVGDVTPVKTYTGKGEKGKTITLVGSGYTGTGLTGPQKEKWDHKTRAVTNRIDDIQGNFIFFKFDAPESKNATELEGISGPGDSGGPAFVQVKSEIFIAGISSHQKVEIEVDKDGKHTGGPGLYGVVEFYSRVSDYEAWIREVMKN